tara:strand:- start:1872 stop:3455 length:1584 start_codon:yes stop_codon:yes gene_type:complete
MQPFGKGDGTPPAGSRANDPYNRFDNTDRVLERVKSLTYSASVNKLLLDIETTATEGSVKTGATGEVDIENTGKYPALAILAYRLWTAEGTMSGNTYHVNYLLKPGEKLVLPDTPALIADEGIEQFDGTAVTNAVPTATANFMYADSGTTLGEDVDDDETDFDVADGDYFRVGDLIQLGINTTTATRIEILRVTAISTNNLTVERGLFGTSIADKDSQTNATSGAVSGAKVYLPYFNIYQNDYNRYSVAQSDAQGRFWAKNFFGVGRAATHLMGITPGSVAIKFYNAGYQNLTNDGDIKASTNSGLSASTTYYLSVSIDGATTDKITFTTDSSNVNFGGASGIMQKLQDSIDALYYNPAKNGFEKKAIVSITDGNLRITSGQHLSTSAISVTTNTDGTAGTDELFDTSNAFGRFPATIPSAVAAKLPDDLVYDRVTYESSPNENVFTYDDGYGNLIGMCSGTINYETGEIHMLGCPANGEFVYSCLHTSPFSGKANATDAAKMNKLKAIYGNMPNQKGAGELTITRR